MSITDFLLARIAEDEAVARAATPGPWTQGRGVTPHVAKRDWVELENQATISHDVRPTDATHIARHDPACVLAECAAKRAIVDIHLPQDYPQYMTYGEIYPCSECGDIDKSPIEWPCPTTRTLAGIYADHSDYQQEWAIE